MAEVGLSIYDAFSTYQTMTSTKASENEKVFSSVGFIAGLALPGGGYGQAGKYAAKITKIAAQRITSKTAQRIFVSQVDKVKDAWYAATFVREGAEAVEHSIAYHYQKHVADKGLKQSLVDYTREAQQFFESYKNSDFAKWGKTLGDTSSGVLIDTGTHRGWFTPDGRIVTYFQK